MVDVDAWIPGRMGPAELLDANRRVEPRCELRARGNAHDGRCLAQPGEQPQAALEIRSGLGHHDLRIGRVRLRVDRGDEERVGRAGGVGHSPEGPRAQRHPEARLHKQRAHILGAADLRNAGPGREGFQFGFQRATGPLGLGELDHNRAQPAPLATKNRLHASRAGRGVAHAGTRSVLEEELAAAHPVALGHGKPRAHARRVISQHRDVGYGRSIVDPLLGLAEHGQIQTFSDAMHRHLARSPPRCAPGGSARWSLRVLRRLR